MASSQVSLPRPLKGVSGGQKGGKTPSHVREVSILGHETPSRRVTVDPLRVKLAIVIDAFGGSKAQTAMFLDVSRSQPGRWLEGRESPNPRARRRIHDFEYVWSRLTDERSPATAAIWLDSPNAFLGGATPLTWLRTRGAEDVVGAIDAEEAGSYA